MLLRKIAIAVGSTLAMSTMAHADVNTQLADLQVQLNQLQAQINTPSSVKAVANAVGMNSNLSWQMMSNYSAVGKEMNLLQARQAGLSLLTVGGQIQADALYDHVNQNSVGAYHFANPIINGTDSGGNTDTRLTITNASLATTAAMGQWVTGYVQVGEPSPGNQYIKIIGAQSNTNVAVQDAYVVFGNLAKLPVYGFAGYKEIDFGSFATVDMYNQPLTRTLFQAQGNTVGVGYKLLGFNGVLSLINGGNHMGVTAINGAVQQENLNTQNNNTLNNFAANASYGTKTGMVNWNMGVGYLNGSQFVSYNNKTDGAWDVNGKVSVKNFDVLAEYDISASKTNIVTNNPKYAQAWDLGADYNFPTLGYSSVVNADYSQAYVGQGGVNQAYQYVLGYRMQPVANVWAGIEYAYSKNLAGFADDAGPSFRIVNPIAGTAVGNNDIKNNTVTLDVTAMF